MDTNYSLFPSVLLLLCTVALVGFRTFRCRRIQLLDYAVLGIAAIYGAVPLFVLRADPSLNGPIWFDLIRFDQREYYSYSLYSTLLLISIVSGWYLGGIFRSKRKVQLEQSATLKPPPAGIFSATGWALLVISFSAYWLYSQSYGGLLGLYEHAGDIRIGKAIVDNYWSFLQPVGAFSLFGSYIFWGLWLAGKRSTQTAAGLLVSVLIAFFVLVSWLGRLAIVVYILTLVQGPILVQQFQSRLKVRHYLAALGVAASFVFAVYGVGIVLKRNEAVPLMDFFVSELGFPMASYSVVNSGITECRNYLDLLQAPLYLAPTRVLQALNIFSVSDRITVDIWGSKDFGQLPTDMVSFCLIEGGVSGIVLLGLAWGLVLRFLETVWSFFPYSGFAEVMYSNISLSVAAISILYADPAHLIRRTFYLVFGLFLLGAGMAVRRGGIRQQWNALTVSRSAPQRA